MPTEAKQLAGVMDLDSAPETVAPSHHRVARNLTFRGEPGNKRAEAVPGNRVLNNPLLPATGLNITRGRFYDAVKKRIYFFNYNNAGNHGIYLYNTVIGTFQRLIEEGVNAVSGTLNFTASTFICNVNIIYGDPLQGDQLFWLNCQGVPCKVNVDKALAGSYGTFQNDYLDVATAPPQCQPYVVYEDDPTVTVNNLRKKLFKIKTRYVYDDNEKSVTSMQSELPLPYNPFDSDIDADPTKNARISITYLTGGATVKKVEILGSVSLGNAWSDYFLISSIDKANESIPDNDIAVFNFYNNQSYTNIDVDESNQIFDYVPLKAVAQEVIAGNTLVFGNITEGYPNITNFRGDITSSYLAVNQEEPFNGRYFSLLVVNQSGNSGFGTGNTHVIVKGKVSDGNVYEIVFNTNTISYTAVPGDDIDDVLTGLITSATGNGFTVTGSILNPDAIYFSKTGAILQRWRVTPNGILENQDNASNGSLMAYPWWSRYAFGLVYFDVKGRTNGVVYPMSDFTVQTIPYADYLTQAYITGIDSYINHRAPDWAKYYSWVRSKNLAKSNYLQWVTDITFKDDFPGTSDQEYAYLSIESVNVFVKNNPGSPLGYGFNPGDRVRFMKRYTVSGSTADQYTDKDFEIYGSVLNPNIGGIDRVGQFIKIKLPPTDASFDFGSLEYNNYFIEMYTPAQPVANGLNVYYEFGERFAIDNPGQPIRTHQGDIDNQSSDLVVAAHTRFIKGDNYQRYRRISVGTSISYTVQPGPGADSDAGRITIGATPTYKTLDDPNVLIGTSPLANLIGFNLATDDSRWLIKIVTGTYTFRVKGVIIVEFKDLLFNDEYEVYLQKNDGIKYQLGTVQKSEAPGKYYYPFDIEVQMSSGQRIFLFGWSVPGLDHLRDMVETTFTITDVRTVTQTIIDPNFSDFYASTVNSNGRAFIYDENAAQLTYQDLYRWSLPFQQSTNINQTNRFYPLNFDNVSLSYGGIMRFGLMEKTMRIFQERKCGFVGIYQRYISQSDGSSGLITSDDIITKNNIQYYVGDSGIGNQSDSLVGDRFRHYFVDPIRGEIIRLSLDGIEIISQLYNAQTFSGNRAPAYLTSYANEQGAVSRISGVLNIRKDLKPEYHSIYQSITDGEGVLLEPGVSLVFNEASNGFERFDDMDPDCMVCAENKLYAFKNGVLYIHDDYENCARFFGDQVEPTLKLIFNKDVGIKKVFDALSYQSNAIWQSPVQGDIKTSMVNPDTGLPQESKLIDDDYEIQENIRYAALLRDQNSMADPDEALWEGDYLNGTYIEVNFKHMENAFAWIYFIYLNYQISQRNF